MNFSQILRKMTNYSLPALLILSILLSTTPVQAGLLDDASNVVNAVVAPVPAPVPVPVPPAPVPVPVPVPVPPAPAPAPSPVAAVVDAVNSVVAPVPVPPAPAPVVNVVNTVSNTASQTVNNLPSTVPAPVVDAANTATTTVNNTVGQVVISIPNTPVSPIINPIVNALTGTVSGALGSVSGLINGTQLPVGTLLDGLGANTVNNNSVVAGSTGNTFIFTYTAAQSMNDGAIKLSIPAGWTAPQIVSGVAGRVTVSSSGITAKVENTLDNATGWASGDFLMQVTSDASDKIEGASALSAQILAGGVGKSSFDYTYSSPQDWSDYTTAGFWMKSAVNILGGQVRLVLRVGNRNTYYDVPALTAGVWQYVVINISSQVDSDEISSYGFRVPLNLVTTYKVDNFSLGPNNTPSISGSDIEVKFISLPNAGTTVLTYGAGGSANGATAPANIGVYNFLTQQRADSSNAELNQTPTSGIYKNLALSPSVTVTDNGNGCTTNCGGGCTVNCGNGCTVNCGSGCVTNCGNGGGCVANCGNGGGCVTDCGTNGGLPVDDVKIVLNNGALITGSRMAVVDMFVGSAKKKMSLSNTPDFKNAAIVDFESPYDWDICGSNSSGPLPCEIGKHIVYAKFYDANNKVSSVATDDIKFEVISALCPFFDTYVRVGSRNAEVLKIKQFLKDIGMYHGDASSNFFDNDLFQSISKFQLKYSDEILVPWEIDYSTGYWYKTTRAKANDVKGCSEIVHLTDAEIHPPVLINSVFIGAKPAQEIVSFEANTPIIQSAQFVTVDSVNDRAPFTANIGGIGDALLGPIKSLFKAFFGF